MSRKPARKRIVLRVAGVLAGTFLVSGGWLVPGMEIGSRSFDFLLGVALIALSIAPSSGSDEFTDLKR